MNGLIRSTALALFVLGLCYAVFSHVYDASKVKVDHLFIAATYEQKAWALKSLIAEHEIMKEEYIRAVFLDKNRASFRSFIRMSKHCEAIVSDAKKRLAHYMVMAEWHKIQSPEMWGVKL